MRATSDDNPRVHGIRFERSLWSVSQYRLGQYEGQITEWVEIGDYWVKAEADAECQRLTSLNADPDLHYDVIEGTARGVYPADESPPWVDDPERLQKRGYDRLFLDLDADQRR